MKYYSTNHHSSNVSFREAMLRSEAADGGLYLPVRLPELPKAFINNLPWMSLSDIAFVINNSLFGEDLPSSVIKRISDESTTYSMPLYEIEPGIHVMEMFHGPTRTIKDFGAQTLTRIISELRNGDSTTLNVMVATTGHSGNAIAASFQNMPGVNVFVLYPKGLSRRHIEHIYTLGENIHLIEVNGRIEDCVSMMNKALADDDLKQSMLLTSANSMNLGSLLPSAIPYFHAYSQLRRKYEDVKDICLSVPCGNGGNLLAAYIARKMGLPLPRIIAACNANGSIHRFLTSESYETNRRSVSTLAYGMDRTYSANAPRFMELCGGSRSALQSTLLSEICSDQDITVTINDVYNRTGYLLDPHSATAYHALKKHKSTGMHAVLMATAHPSLSAENIERISGGDIKMPVRLPNHHFCLRPETVIPPSYPALKKHLLYYNHDNMQQSQFA